MELDHQKPRFRAAISSIRQFLQTIRRWIAGRRKRCVRIVPKRIFMLPADVWPGLYARVDISNTRETKCRLCRIIKLTFALTYCHYHRVSPERSVFMKRIFFPLLFAAFAFLGSRCPAQDNILSQIQNLHRRDVKFEGFILSEPQNVSVKVVAAGRKHPLWTRAWILNSETRERVWDMRHSSSDDDDRSTATYTDDLSLPKGTYEVVPRVVPVLLLEYSRSLWIDRLPRGRGLPLERRRQLLTRLQPPLGDRYRQRDASERRSSEKAAG